VYMSCKQQSSCQSSANTCRSLQRTTTLLCTHHFKHTHTVLQNVAPWMSALHSAFAIGALTAPVAVGLFQPLPTFIALAAIAAPTGAAAVWLGCHRTARDCGKIVSLETGRKLQQMADLGAGGWRRVSGTWVQPPIRRSKC
jgi:hypothetical protein